MTREEAIEIIKRNSTSGSDLRKACELFIPELAESDDEKIRKGLIEIFNSALGQDFLQRKAGLDRDKVITYLEKQKEMPTNEEMLRTLHVEYEKGVADTIAKYEQKEPKPSIFPPGLGEVRWNPISSVEQKTVERSLEDDHIIGFVYDLLNEIEWKDNWAMSKDECLQRLNNYSPQKPTEWSEKDEKMLQYIVSDLCYFRDCETDDESVSDYEDEIAWLKSLPERFSLQPKQEWSEEDERRFISCMGRLQTADGAPTNNSDWFEEHCYNHPSWKPSEEQMDRLFSIVAALRKDYCDDMADFLANLYAELKKLM